MTEEKIEELIRRSAQLEQAVKDTKVALRPYGSHRLETAETWKKLYAADLETARGILEKV